MASARGSRGNEIERVAKSEGLVYSGAGGWRCEWRQDADFLKSAGVH